MLTQATYGADRNYPFDSQAFERPDIGAHRYLGRTDTMPSPVARQEGHRDAFYLAHGDHIARISKGSLYCNLLDVGHALHTVEPTAADNANMCFWHINISQATGRPRGSPLRFFSNPN